MNKIQEILKKAIESANDYNTEYEWSGRGHEDRALAKAEADLIQLFELVVGEDPQFFEDGSMNPMPYEEHNIREKLRAEQRQMIKELREGL